MIWTVPPTTGVEWRKLIANWREMSSCAPTFYAAPSAVSSRSDTFGDVRWAQMATFPYPGSRDKTGASNTWLGSRHLCLWLPFRRHHSPKTPRRRRVPQMASQSSLIRCAPVSSTFSGDAMDAWKEATQKDGDKDLHTFDHLGKRKRDTNQTRPPPLPHPSSIGPWLWGRGRVDEDGRKTDFLGSMLDD